MSDRVLQLEHVSRQSGGLRPLRIAELIVRAGDRVAVAGLDGPSAETFVNLLTGASLPGEGRVSLFGRDTSSITDADDWLATLDRLGIMSARAVLLEDLTIAQNVAMAFTLSIDPVPDDVLAGVRRLANEVGMAGTALDTRVAGASVAARARCHLAKALALNPSFLVLEHANALAGEAATDVGRTVAAIVKARGLSMLALTADERFARVVASRVLVLNPASGALRERSGWRHWLTPS